MKLFDIPNTPFALEWDQWDEWEARARKQYPVRWFLSRTVPRFFRRNWARFVREPWYWLKCRVWHQYNVVRIKTLPPTWMDRDRVLLHAAFQILTDYVEREQPWESKATAEEVRKCYEDFGDCESRVVNAMELQRLYRWWTVERPARKEPDAPDGGNARDEAWQVWADKQSKLERAWDDEDNAMLKRLIDIRLTLWT